MQCWQWHHCNSEVRQGSKATWRSGSGAARCRRAAHWQCTLGGAAARSHSDRVAVTTMAFLEEFLGLSPPSQGTVLAVAGTAAWIAIRLALQVLRLVLRLLPAPRPAAATPEPR